MINSIHSVTILILLCSTVTLVHNIEYNQGRVAHHHQLVHGRDEDRPLAMADHAAAAPRPDDGGSAVHLLNYFSDMLGSEREYIRDMTKTERDHTTKKLSIITHNYNSRLKTFDDAMEKLVDN